jgi:dGTPase
MTEISVRAMLETREREQLAPWATCASASKGRPEAEPEDPYRTVFQRDRDRILHCKAFRRLKRKTQVFLAPQDDHYRTRLSHTLEVAQISRTVARALRLNEDLTEAIALGHDLGHTPFGHAGERVLNKLCPGGFRHNEQSLRVVDIIERRGGKRGLNLTEEVRDGIRYHSEGKALFSRRETTVPRTPEGRVLSLCDAIAYISHDVDDAMHAGVLAAKSLPPLAVRVLGDSTSARIDRMVVGIIKGSHEERIGIQEDVLEAMIVLRTFLYAEIYPSASISREIAKAEDLLQRLFEYFHESPPPALLKNDSNETLTRRITDFVAGMTDEYALELFSRHLLPKPWSRP